MSTWRRNLYVIWVAEFTAIAGFSLALPFIPYYIQELGVTGPGEVEFWTGFLFSAMATMMAIFSPVWGALADRFGRKLMVERAMFGGAVILGLMGMVQNVYQLLILRLLQGAITGTVAAATTLVATTVPKERTGSAVASLQMAIYLGATGGPLIGGVIADALGYRMAFFITGALLLIGGVLVMFFVREEFQPAPRAGRTSTKGPISSFRTLLRHRNLLLILIADAIVRLGARISRPMLPLFVQALLPTTDRVASITGLITGFRALAGAAGAMLSGYLADRAGYPPVLLGCALLASVFYSIQYFAGDVSQLLAFQVMTGIAMGGTLAVMSAALAYMAPEGRQGTVYGIENSISSIANATGPMLGAAIAVSLGIRFAFLGAGLFFLAAALGFGLFFLIRSRAHP